MTGGLCVSIYSGGILSGCCFVASQDPTVSSSLPLSSPSPFPLSQLAICCRQLQSKDQALKILKQELDLSQEQVEQCRQEIAQLVRERGRERKREEEREYW